MKIYNFAVFGAAIYSIYCEALVSLSFLRNFGSLNTLPSEPCQVFVPNCEMMSLNFNYYMVRAKPFLTSNKQRKPRTLVDLKRQADQKKPKHLEERYHKLTDVDEIVCCGRNCLERAVPNDEVKQSLRDEYFDLRDDCQRKQWLKDVFLFGFVDGDD
jgi:hypothetical protein